MLIIILVIMPENYTCACATGYEFVSFLIDNRYIAVHVNIKYNATYMGASNGRGTTVW